MKEFLETLPEAIKIGEALREYRQQTGATLRRGQFIVLLARAGAKFDGERIIHGRDY